jgi:hypothetical protein
MGAARADDVNGAAKAFGQAQEAMLAGDPARAADLYELADELAPSAPALRNAARARLAANHEAMAATLAAELLRRYASDKESRDVAEAILSKLSPRLAQFEVICDEDCTVTLDGKAASGKPRTSHMFFAQPGARTVGATFDGGRQATKQVTALVGQATGVKLEAPAKPVPVQPVVRPETKPEAPLVVTSTVTPRAHGLSRTWVVVGGIATVGFGAAATIEGLATLDTRDQIKSAVAAGDSAHAMSLYTSGRNQQLLTNVFFGATAAAGVATVLLGFATNWSGRDMAVTPTAGGAAVVYAGRF